MNTSPDAGRILDIATGYMASQQLFQASRIGLFAAVGDAGATAADIAERTGVSERMARILADAMASLGLLERTASRYALTPEAAEYLVGPESGIDLGPFLTFLAEISYPHWLQFPRTVDTTEPGDLQMDDARWATFMAGVMTYNRLHGREFGRRIDLSGASTALDLGGLSAAFAIEAMAANPGLRTTFVYAPGFEDGVASALADAGMSERAVVQTAPTESAQPEGPFDAVFVNHVIHRFAPDQNREILRHARSAAAEGAVLTLLDFFLDDDDEQRSLDAQHAGEYLVIDGTVVYPESEVREWLAETGWRVVDKVALPASPRVLVAVAE